MSLLFQLEQSQWLSTDQLWSHQCRQLTELLTHVYRTVPFYRQRLKAAKFNPGKKVTSDLWHRLPILTREEVQEAGARLRSGAIPKRHGGTFTVSTSGSTATPVTVQKTWVSSLYYNAINMRDHLWHRHDLSGMLCAIRPEFDRKAASYPRGLSWDRWEGATPSVFETGPSAGLHVHTAIEDQIEWLLRKNPSFLITVTSNLHALANYCSDEGVKFPKLKYVSAFGEVLTEEVRSACRDAWGVNAKDIYSTVEVGYMGLQCPENDHLHAQGEVTLIEILDEQGQPCAPGETGRVVATPLHNYAMPLIRYAVGDYAVAGEPCSCGRGLPVIEKILGRTRNILRLPDGRSFFPSFAGHIFSELAPVKQYQMLQKTLDTLELRFVVKRPLTTNEEDAVRDFIRERLDYPFEIEFAYVDVIERALSGKFEEFKSEVADPTSTPA